jgi:hypothetical protein
VRVIVARVRVIVARVRAIVAAVIVLYMAAVIYKAAVHPPNSVLTFLNSLNDTLGVLLSALASLAHVLIAFHCI